MSQAGKRMDLDRMEDTVANSLRRFESAMERLTEKLDESGDRLQHIMELGRRQRDKLLDLQHKTKDTIQPVIETVRETSHDVKARVQSNPRPFIFSAIGLIGSAIFLGFYFKNRKKSSSFDISRDESVSPGVSGSYSSSGVSSSEYPTGGYPSGAATGSTGGGNYFDRTGS